MIEDFQLRPMQEQDRATVLGLHVAASQQPFVEPIADTLALTQPARDNHVIAAGGAIIGFFQIETENLKRFQGASARELELHEVFIDTQMQGQGFGRLFIQSLADYIRENYLDWRTIALSVNCKNLTAYGLYQKGGFIDTGQLWTEGRSGPQHVMRMHLREIIS